MEVSFRVLDSVKIKRFIRMGSLHEGQVYQDVDLGCVQKQDYAAELCDQQKCHSIG